MAISNTQKIDFLWKKLGYGFSKTETSSNKLAVNESISSPLLLRGDTIWTQSGSIPSVQPGSSSSLVTVYPTSTPLECTNDGSASQNRTWLTGVGNWISPEFGATFIIKVYIHTSGDAANAASSGTQVLASGSGNNDEWFFDYQSGVLNFNGTNLPSGVNFSGKSVYISGAKYNGNIGFNHVELNSLSVSGIVTATTFSGSLPTTDLTGTITNTQLAGSIPYAKLQNVSNTNRILGRDSAGAGVIEEITSANLLTMLGIEAGATADQTASEILTAIKTVDGSGSGLDADTLDGLDLHTGRNDNANKVVRTQGNGYCEFGWINTTSGAHTSTVTKVYSTYTTDGYIRYCTPNHLANSMTNVLHSDAADTFSGDLTSSGSARILLKKTDNDVSDHIIFYNGTTRIGEIGCEDTTWLRINQETDKNIYTPRYIRADAGFFVDGITKGINGSGNFIGGTIAGASDYGTLLRSNASDSASGRITFSANDTNSWDTIATGSGSQGCIEVYNSGGGTDAFMSFHVGGDYACYFGLDGGTNKLSVGGWSMGANSYEIYHSGNKPSLATLGYTGATNANYITNVNQLTNGSGFITGFDITTQTDSKYLRSDTADTATGELTFNGRVNIRGHIDLSDNEYLYFGSGDDVEFFCNGSHMYMDLNTGIGNFYIRDGSTTRYTFDDNGSFTASSNITAYSDITLKKNIEVIPNALDKVMQLRGVNFDRKDIETSRQSGVIAQEVEKVLPEVVATNDEGIKSVAYGNMVGLLIEAIKEQQQQIDELKRKLEEK